MGRTTIALCLFVAVLLLAGPVYAPKSGCGSYCQLSNLLDSKYIVAKAPKIGGTLFKVSAPFTNVNFLEGTLTIDIEKLSGERNEVIVVIDKIEGLQSKRIKSEKIKVGKQTKFVFNGQDGQELLKDGARLVLILKDPADPDKSISNTIRFSVSYQKEVAEISEERLQEVHPIPKVINVGLTKLKLVNKAKAVVVGSGLLAELQMPVPKIEAEIPAKYSDLEIKTSFEEAYFYRPYALLEEQRALKGIESMDAGKKRNAIDFFLSTPLTDILNIFERETASIEEKIEKNVLDEWIEKKILFKRPVFLVVEADASKMEIKEPEFNAVASLKATSPFAKWLNEPLEVSVNLTKPGVVLSHKDSKLSKVAEKIAAEKAWDFIEIEKDLFSLRTYANTDKMELSHKIGEKSYLWLIDFKLDFKIEYAGNESKRNLASDNWRETIVSPDRRIMLDFKETDGRKAYFDTRVLPPELLDKISKGFKNKEPGFERIEITLNRNELPANKEIGQGLEVKVSRHGSSVSVFMRNKKIMEASGKDSVSVDQSIAVIFDKKDYLHKVSFFVELLPKEIVEEIAKLSPLPQPIGFDTRAVAEYDGKVYESKRAYGRWISKDFQFMWISQWSKNNFYKIPEDILEELKKIKPIRIKATNKLQTITLPEKGNLEIGLNKNESLEIKKDGKEISFFSRGNDEMFEVSFYKNYLIEVVQNFEHKKRKSDNFMLVNLYPIKETIAQKLNELEKNTPYNKTEHDSGLPFSKELSNFTYETNIYAKLELLFNKKTIFAIGENYVNTALLKKISRDKMEIIVEDWSFKNSERFEVTLPVMGETTLGNGSTVRMDRSLVKAYNDYCISIEHEGNYYITLLSKTGETLFKGKVSGEYNLTKQEMSTIEWVGNHENGVLLRVKKISPESVVLEVMFLEDVSTKSSIFSFDLAKKPAIGGEVELVELCSILGASLKFNGEEFRLRSNDSKPFDNAEITFKVKDEKAVEIKYNPQLEKTETEVIGEVELVLGKTVKKKGHSIKLVSYDSSRGRIALEIDGSRYSSNIGVPGSSLNLSDQASFDRLASVKNSGIKREPKATLLVWHTNTDISNLPKRKEEITVRVGEKKKVGENEIELYSTRITGATVHYTIKDYTVEGGKKAFRIYTDEWRETDDGLVRAKEIKTRGPGKLVIRVKGDDQDKELNPKNNEVLLIMEYRKDFFKALEIKEVDAKVENPTEEKYQKGKTYILSDGMEFTIVDFVPPAINIALEYVTAEEFAKVKWEKEEFELEAGGRKELKNGETFSLDLVGFVGANWRKVELRRGKHTAKLATVEGKVSHLYFFEDKKVKAALKKVDSPLFFASIDLIKGNPEQLKRSEFEFIQELREKIIKKYEENKFKETPLNYLMLIGSFYRLPAFDQRGWFSEVFDSKIKDSVLDSLVYGNTDDDKFTELSVGRIPFSEAEKVYWYFRDLPYSRSEWKMASAYYPDREFVLVPESQLKLWKDFGLYPKVIANEYEPLFENRLQEIKSEDESSGFSMTIAPTVEQLNEILENSDYFSFHSHGCPDGFVITTCKRDRTGLYCMDDVPAMGNRAIVYGQSCSTGVDLGPAFLEAGASIYNGSLIPVPIIFNIYPIDTDNPNTSVGDHFKEVVNGYLSLVEDNTYERPLSSFNAILGDPSIRLTQPKLKEEKNYSVKAEISKGKKRIVIEMPKIDLDAGLRDSLELTSIGKQEMDYALFLTEKEKQNIKEGKLTKDVWTDYEDNIRNLMIIGSDREKMALVGEEKQRSFFGGSYLLIQEFAEDFVLDKHGKAIAVKLDYDGAIAITTSTSNSHTFMQIGNGMPFIIPTENPAELRTLLDASPLHWRIDMRKLSFRVGNSEQFEAKKSKTKKEYGKKDLQVLIAYEDLFELIKKGALENGFEIIMESA